MRKFRVGWRTVDSRRRAGIFDIVELIEIDAKKKKKREKKEWKRGSSAWMERTKLYLL